MRRLRENTTLESEISKTGEVTVEGHLVGRLEGFRFAADPSAGGSEAKALHAAAQKALAGEIDARAAKLAQAPDEQFVLTSDGTIRWTGDAVGKLVAGEEVLRPRIRILADDQLTGAAREQVQARLDLWIKAHIDKLLGPLSALAAAEDVTGIARGVAYRLIEDLGVLERQKVADDVKGLDQGSRAALRKYGVRFGAYHLYVPPLLKPAPRALATLLYAIKNDSGDMRGLDEVQQLASSGRTSIPANKDVPKNLYRVAGYRVAGERAVRVDILERLADLIRPALAWRNNSPGVKPQGALDGTGFTVTVGMTSLVGSSGEDFASILRSLGYRMERRPKPPEPVSPPETVEAELAPQPAESGAADGIGNAATEIANDNAPIAAAEGRSGRAIEPEPIVSDPAAESQQSAGTDDQQTIADASASAEPATEPTRRKRRAGGHRDRKRDARRRRSANAASDGEPSRVNRPVTLRTRRRARRPRRPISPARCAGRSRGAGADRGVAAGPLRKPRETSAAQASSPRASGRPSGRRQARRRLRLRVRPRASRRHPTLPRRRSGARTIARTSGRMGPVLRARIAAAARAATRAVRMRRATASRTTGRVTGCAAASGAARARAGSEFSVREACRPEGAARSGFKGAPLVARDTAWTGSGSTSGCGTRGWCARAPRRPAWPTMVLVRLNGVRVDAASRAVRIGDVITVALDRIRVLAGDRICRAPRFCVRGGRSVRGYLAALAGRSNEQGAAGVADAAAVQT